MGVPASVFASLYKNGATVPSRRSAEIAECFEISPGIVRIAIRDEYIAKNAKPAQFANFYTRNSQRLMPRPFGIADIEDDKVGFIFAVVGKGTEEFKHYRAGEKIDVLGPFGKPFDTSKSCDYLLVGGGLGVPPLIRAAQSLSEREDARAVSVFGYRDEQFAQSYVSKYVANGDSYAISDRDGNVVDLLETVYASRFGKLDGASDKAVAVILSCGPAPMMKAVAKWAAEHGNIETQLSLEARMGCGFGACYGCVAETASGLKKVCSDGPVFTSEELGWQQ